MSWDATSEILTGATIRRAYRDYPWLVLELTNGLTVHTAGGRVRRDLECPKCREFRLVEIVNDASGEQGFCSVCAHSWWVKRKCPAPVNSGGGVSAS